MKMPASQQPIRSAKADRLVALVLGLVFIALGSVRLPAQLTNGSNGSSTSPAPRPLQPRPDGTLVVPVTDKSGNRTEPMILVPLAVQARSLSSTTARPPE